MGKSLVIYIKFLHDVAYQKLLKSANVSRSYWKNNTGTVFFWDVVYTSYESIKTSVNDQFDCGSNRRIQTDCEGGWEGLWV